MHEVNWHFFLAQGQLDSGDWHCLGPEEEVGIELRSHSAAHTSPQPHSVVRAVASPWRTSTIHPGRLPRVHPLCWLKVPISQRVGCRVLVGETTVREFPLSTAAFSLCDRGQWSAVSGPCVGGGGAVRYFRGAPYEVQAG